MERSEGGARFEARVARNALGIVERELRLGPAIAAAHAARLAGLGFADDAALAAAIRAGALDDGVGAGRAGARRVGPRPAAGGEPLLLAGGAAGRASARLRRRLRSVRLGLQRGVRHLGHPAADALQQERRPAGCRPS